MTPFPDLSGYQVLARRYRPQFFRDVVGQDLFVRMIQNAIKEKRLGHGLLLMGVRGVGKTTLARLIAKTLVCHQLEASIQQGIVEPCGQCTACHQVVQEKHLDISEIDAASYTGVDDIRQITDACSYRAVMGPYKIYIIDEAHMLSRNAFNALLKTLEEPPAHVKFLLATTEAHKILPTVRSRCQKLPLKRLDVETLVPFLHGICTKEGVASEEEALRLIAQKAEGGGRDALSLLEQAILLSDKTITLEGVRAMLGCASETQIDTLMQTILNRQAAQSQDCLAQLYEQGVSAHSILSDLSALFHQRVLAALIHNPGHDVGHDMRLWQMINKGIQEMAQATFPWAALEMLIMRLIYMGQFPTPQELLQGFSAGKAPPPSCSPATSVSTPWTFEALLDYVAKQREGLLYTHLTQHVSFVDWSPEHLTLHWVEKGDMPAEMVRLLERCLKDFTGKAQRIIFSPHPGQPTWVVQEENRHQVLREKALAHPLMQKATALFPGAILEAVQEV